MTGQPSRPESHVPELDGARGIAILLVMALHFVCSQIPYPESRLEFWAAKLTGYGEWGVDLFFVLSGYLITGILWDTRGRPRYFKTFYARRSLRIFPLYYAVIALFVLTPAALWHTLAPDALRVRELQGWLWSYLTNVYVARSGSFSIPYVSHFWSLAIEEHYYLAWPFVVGLCSRVTSMRVCVALILGSFALRVALGYAGYNALYADVLTPCRLDSLCVGAWLALAKRAARDHARRSPASLGAAALAALGVLLTSAWHARFASAEPLVQSLRTVCLALFFGQGLLLASNADGPGWLKAPLRARWLRWLGKYSYGLYVFHGIIAYGFASRHALAFFARLAGTHARGLALQAVVGSLVSVGVAVLSYELFESYFLRLKDRFQTRAAAADGA